MTEWAQAILLAVVQGLTEFLPISSSAHLILPAQLFGWADQGVAFDTAVHVGSLLAVLLYFRDDLQALASGCMAAMRQGVMNAEARLVMHLAIASIPVALAGLLFIGLISEHLRSIPVIAATTIGFGILLALADRKSAGSRELDWRSALWIGMAQVLALVPGTSRSGITMTAALFCGMGREQAARFSFLLSIPVILAAALLATVSSAESGQGVSWPATLTAMAISAVTAYATIALFLAWVERLGFLPFAIYRCLLGIGLLAIWAL